jgi:hypothetical protein
MRAIGKERSMNTLWVIVGAMRRTLEEPEVEHVPYRPPWVRPARTMRRTRMLELEAENAALRREVAELRTALNRRARSPLSL